MNILTEDMIKEIKEYFEEYVLFECYSPIVVEGITYMVEKFHLSGLSINTNFDFDNNSLMSKIRSNELNLNVSITTNHVDIKEIVD
jgi:hypothetical protein